MARTPGLWAGVSRVRRRPCSCRLKDDGRSRAGAGGRGASTHGVGSLFVRRRPCVSAPKNRHWKNIVLATSVEFCLNRRGDEWGLRNSAAVYHTLLMLKNLNRSTSTLPQRTVGYNPLPQFQTLRCFFL